MSTRKTFIKNMASGSAAVILPTFFQKLAKAADNTLRPNIVWLDSEDNCPDIGCYGTPLVNTPNLDKLAGEGARYTHTFTSCPVCSPARSAYITGMYQTSIGAQNHRSHRGDGFQLPPPVRPITKYFMEAGYFCTRGSFDNMKQKGKTDYNFSYKFDHIFNGPDWHEHKTGQPFFAQIHFEETHRPFAPEDKEPPDVRYRIDPNQLKLPSYLADHPLLRQDWAFYLESWEVLDRKVGMVLKELDKAGLSGNTVIFFTGDGGRPNYRCKDWLYDGGIHIPLLVRWPGRIKPGSVNHRLISGIDFAPTWMYVAGIEPPSYLQGCNFLTDNIPEREYIYAARDRYDEIADRIRCVRSRQFKYIRNFYPEQPYIQGNLYKKRRMPAVTLMPYLQKQGKLNAVQQLFLAKTRPPEELYDVIKDPDEVNNLAKDPAYQKTLKLYRAKLDDWIYETKDQGQVPEDPEVVAYWKKEMYRQYVGWMQMRGLSPDISDEDYLNWWEERNKRLTD